MVRRVEEVFTLLATTPQYLHEGTTMTGKPDGRKPDDGKPDDRKPEGRMPEGESGVALDERKGACWMMRCRQLAFFACLLLERGVEIYTRLQ
jgi:hypothetical protein